MRGGGWADWQPAKIAGDAAVNSPIASREIVFTGGLLIGRTFRHTNHAKDWSEVSLSRHLAFVGSCVSETMLPAAGVKIAPVLTRLYGLVQPDRSNLKES